MFQNRAICFTLTFSGARHFTTTWITWVFPEFIPSFIYCVKCSNFCSQVNDLFILFCRVLSHFTAVCTADSCMHSSKAIFVTYENVGTIGISEEEIYFIKLETKLLLFKKIWGKNVHLFNSECVKPSTRLSSNFKSKSTINALQFFKLSPNFRMKFAQSLVIQNIWLSNEPNQLPPANHEFIEISIIELLPSLWNKRE